MKNIRQFAVMATVCLCLLLSMGKAQNNNASSHPLFLSTLRINHLCSDYRQALGQQNAVALNAALNAIGQELVFANTYFTELGSPEILEMRNEWVTSFNSLGGLTIIVIETWAVGNNQLSNSLRHDAIEIVNELVTEGECIRREIQELN